jgi:hypothetical protein
MLHHLPLPLLLLLEQHVLFPLLWQMQQGTSSHREAS